MEHCEDTKGKGERDFLMIFFLQYQHIHIVGTN